LLLYLLINPLAFGQRPLPKVEPDPPKETPTYGSLQVITAPAGAQVYLNNRLLGETTSVDNASNNGQLDKPIQLKPGRYKVAVKMAEYEEDSRYITIKSGVPESAVFDLKANFGYLILSGIEIGADINIALDDQAVQPVAPANSDDKNSVARIKAALGEHELKITRTGYAAFKMNVTVSRAENIIPVKFNKEQGTLIVKTNPGARIYINDGDKGLLVPSSGELKIAELVANQPIKLLIEKDGFESRDIKAEVAPNSEKSLDLNLTPLPTSIVFDENFYGGLNLWNAPKEWTAKNGLLSVMGSGVGMPKNKIFRDCEITFGLKLVDPKGAAWVLHAKNENNYYLFYLTGATSKYPNQLRAYICSEGKFDFDNFAATPQKIRIPITNDEYYRIYIKIEGNVIHHWIQPVKTGEKIPIGVFQDEKKIYDIGNVGFAAIDGENFLIHGLSIKPLN
jgi:hypothetical protein